MRLCLPEVLRSTARVRFVDGEAAAARQLLSRAVGIAEADGQRHKLGGLWNTMGMCLAEDDPVAACDAFRTALDHMARMGSTLLAPATRCNLALCLYVSNDVDGAWEALAPTLSRADEGRGRQLGLLLAFASTPREATSAPCAGVPSSTRSGWGARTVATPPATGEPSFASQRPPPTSGRAHRSPRFRGSWPSSSLSQPRPRRRPYACSWPTPAASSRAPKLLRPYLRRDVIQGRRDSRAGYPPFHGRRS